MKYKKKPVIVEAYQTNKAMTGVNGEQYPCKPDIFEKTYEPIEADTGGEE